MIHVRFRTAPDVPWVRVDLDDARLEDVLIRAADRCSFQLEGEALRTRNTRYDAVMREREATTKKEAKRGA